MKRFMRYCRAVGSGLLGVVLVAGAVTASSSTALAAPSVEHQSVAWDTGSDVRDQVDVVFATSSQFSLDAQDWQTLVDHDFDGTQLSAAEIMKPIVHDSHIEVSHASPDWDSTREASYFDMYGGDNPKDKYLVLRHVASTRSGRSVDARITVMNNAQARDYAVLATVPSSYLDIAKNHTVKDFQPDDLVRNYFWPKSRAFYAVGGAALHVTLTDSETGEPLPDTTVGYTSFTPCSVVYMVDCDEFSVTYGSEFTRITTSPDSRLRVDGHTVTAPRNDTHDFLPLDQWQQWSHGAYFTGSSFTVAAAEVDRPSGFGFAPQYAAVKQATITLNTEQGTPFSPIRADLHQKITLPTPTRDGYQFVGWSTKPDGTGPTLVELTVDQDATLYAVWRHSVPMSELTPADARDNSHSNSDGSAVERDTSTQAARQRPTVSVSSNHADTHVGSLADTGANIAMLVSIGIALTVVAGIMLAVSRRKRG